MLKIDNNLLQEIGLGSLPDTEKNSLLKHIYETLEMRVGMRLADQMTNQQLDEFEQYFEAKDDPGAFKWLESNFPNYKDIVQEEFDKLKAEVQQSASGILGASQQAQVVAQTATAPSPAQPQPQAVPPSPASAYQQPQTVPAPQPYQPQPAAAQVTPQPYAAPVVPQFHDQSQQFGQPAPAPLAPVQAQPAQPPTNFQPQPVTPVTQPQPATDPYQQPQYPQQQPPAGPAAQ